jgi:hypothetical protein
VDSTVFLCDENESLAAVTLFGKRFKEKSFSRIVKVSLRLDINRLGGKCCILLQYLV